jgi:parvulin-like peptidyl-prolyl isomerase
LIPLSACGPKDKSEIKVAEVGGRVITVDYFERKMNAMDPQYLPPEIETVAGRDSLLTIMINKEVMAIKAEELGMDADGEAQMQADAVATLKAVTRMKEDIVAPAQEVSEDEIYDYYENLARVLQVSYMLFDHEAQAIEAKGLVEGGESWTTVARRFDAGDPGPNKDWTLEMKYGTVADDLEKIAFELPVGAVSEPLDTIYGWFLIRVDGQTIDRLAPLDSLRDKILQSIRKQESALLIKAHIEKVFEEYGFELDESVLDTLWTALPDDWNLVPPPPTEELVPLRLEPRHMDLVLMKYDDQVWTLRRYNDFYNQSSALGRPRRERRLGGLRRSLKEIAVRELMPKAAEKYGYRDDPEVRDEYKERLEQAMVTRLHGELVRGKVDVSPEEVEQYWIEHQSELIRPETREVFALVTSDYSEALAARLEFNNGAAWGELIEKYCIAGEGKDKGGALGEMTSEDAGPIAAAAFEIETENDASGPHELSEDRWLVVKVGKITPRSEPTFADLKLRIGQMIQAQKEEVLFQEKVAEWRQGIKIRRYPENLMKAVYDPQPRQTGVSVDTGVTTP